jgi:hypothetical protein
MHKKQEIFKDQGKMFTAYYFDIADQCPICRNHIQPKRLFYHGRSIDGTTPDFLWIVYQCPSYSCHEVFSAKFSAWTKNKGKHSDFNCLAR